MTDNKRETSSQAIMEDIQQGLKNLELPATNIERLATMQRHLEKLEALLIGIPELSDSVSTSSTLRNAVAEDRRDRYEGHMLDNRAGLFTDEVLEGGVNFEEERYEEDVVTNPNPPSSPTPSDGSSKSLTTASGLMELLRYTVRKYNQLYGLGQPYGSPTQRLSLEETKRREETFTTRSSQFQEKIAYVLEAAEEMVRVVEQLGKEVEALKGLLAVSEVPTDG